MKPKVAAILIADLHISEKPPICRSNEDSWFAAQARAINQVKQLAKDYKAPVICAGDVFDKSNASSKLINFALDILPHMYSIAGNHDLVNHRLDSIEHTAFWTLVKAGKITYLPPDQPVSVLQAIPLRLHGFSYGVPLKPLTDPFDLVLDVAVVHDFLWVSDTGYPGAPEDKNLVAWKDKVKGYDAAVFGDNHIPLLSTRYPCQILNCGSLMRLTTVQRYYVPHVGLLYDDSSICQVPLDVSKDKFTDSKKVAAKLKGAGIQNFLDELQRLEDASVDFTASVNRKMDEKQVSSEVREMIVGAMEDGGK